MKFRTLNETEIDCRVQAVKANGLSLLLYKDARVDMRLLDEEVGALNWKRSHEVVDGRLCCTVSIWDESKHEWVSKQDVGTESQTEKDKGQFSDAFKRACFNIGIGRELYTAPFIWIDARDCNIEPSDRGKFKCYDRFTVKRIGYDENGCINDLAIVNEKFHRVVFDMNAPKGAPKRSKPTPPTESMDKLATKVERDTFMDMCEALGVDYKEIGRRAGAVSLKTMTSEQHGKAMVILKDIEESRNGQ